MATNLYVGNLPYQLTTDELSDHFAQVGTVANCTIITDRNTGRSKGFGFVEMSTDEEAKKAIEELNGKDFKGRPLRINEARPREERGPRQ
jgi:RNA recognition motif-containing protein